MARRAQAPAAPEGHAARAANDAPVKASERYGILLLALVATFFYGGVATPGGAQRAIATVLGGATLVLALWVADVRPRRLRLAALGVAAMVAATLVALIAGHGQTVEGLAAVANGLLVALAPPAVVHGLLRQVRTTGTINLPVVAGVLCLYLFVGLFFAYVFVAVQNLGGDPFFANGQAANSSNAIYFSFVTITTVGYGDFTARSDLGHTLAVTEALLGQIYLVTIVAGIVSRLVPRQA